MQAASFRGANSGSNYQPGLDAVCLGSDCSYRSLRIRCTRSLAREGQASTQVPALCPRVLLITILQSDLPLPADAEGLPETGRALSDASG